MFFFWIILRRPGHGCNSSHHLKRRGNSCYGMLNFQKQFRQIHCSAGAQSHPEQISVKISQQQRRSKSHRRRLQAACS